MPFGTACGRLRKSILFSLLKKHNENVCFQCGNKIEKEEDLSIEHKIPYLDSENPTKLFFDLDNIAFSHLKCNIGSARNVQIQGHNASGYKRGCRCEICVQANKDAWQRYKPKRKYKSIRSIPGDAPAFQAGE